MTKAQFRDEIKAAFEAGWEAARRSQLKPSWENSSIRKELDYHGRFERLEEAARTPGDQP